MEQGQEFNSFQPLTKEELWPISRKFEALSKWQSGYIDPSKTDSFFRKVLSYFYMWLDSLSGEQNWVLFNGQDYSLSAFYKIIQFLKTHKIVNRVWSLQTRYNDAPSFSRFGLEPAYPEAITDGWTQVNPFGHGFGKDVETASSKAIGEFLERYFLTLYQKRNLIRSSWQALRKKGVAVLDLELLAGFSEEQKQRQPILRWNEKSVFWWEKVKQVSTGKIFHIPAQLVYWNYNKDEGEPLLVDLTTNGCGGYFSQEGAVLSGLYELIQRDAFLIYWLNKLVPPKIKPESVPDEIFQSILKESQRYGFEIHCLNTTSDTQVPSFVVVIEDKSGIGPKFCLGGGSQSNAAKALRRALEEAWSVYYWMRPNPPYFLPESYQPFNDQLIGQNERLRLWANPVMARYYSFLLDGKEHKFSEISFSYPQEFSSEKEELAFLVKRIESLGKGYEVYYYIASHPVLSQLGYFSARVIVPQLIPLYLRETMAPLGAIRLKDVPAKLGYKSLEAFNPWPHPFP